MVYLNLQSIDLKGRRVRGFYSQLAKRYPRTGAAKFVVIAFTIETIYTEYIRSSFFEFRSTKSQFLSGEIQLHGRAGQI